MNFENNCQKCSAFSTTFLCLQSKHFRLIKNKIYTTSYIFWGRCRWARFGLGKSSWNVFFFRSGEIASCQSSREISHRWTNQTYSVMNPSGARSVVLVPNNPKVTAVFIRWSVICGRRWPAYYNYISLSLVRKLSKRNKITDPSRMGK